MSNKVIVLNANEDEYREMFNLLKEGGFNPFVVNRLEGLKDTLQETNCIVAILDLDSTHLDNRTIQELKRQFPEVYFLCTSKNRLPDELFYWLRSIIKNETEFQPPQNWGSV